MHEIYIIFLLTYSLNYEDKPVDYELKKTKIIMLVNRIVKVKTIKRYKMEKGMGRYTFIFL